MQCRAKAKIKEQENFDLQRAFGVIANTALKKAINSRVKTFTTQERLRHAVHTERDRIWLKEFRSKDGKDKVYMATQKYFVDMIKYFDIKEISIAEIKQDIDKPLAGKEIAVAFLMLYVLCFYNVADDFVKYLKWQKQIVNDFVKDYLNIFAQLDHMFRGDLNEITKYCLKNTIYKNEEVKQEPQSVDFLTALQIEKFRKEATNA